MKEALVLLLLTAPAFAQRDAREQEYYDWCRGQGGTPEGTLDTLHCTPPSDGSGQADGGVIAAPTNIKDAILFGVMKGLANGVIKGIQESATERRNAAAMPASPPPYAPPPGDAAAATRRELEARERADEDAKRRELQRELVMPAAAAPRSDGDVRAAGGARRSSTGESLAGCRGAQRRSLECLDSDEIDVPPPPFLAKEDEAKALATQKQLADELDLAHVDRDVSSMNQETGDWLNHHAQDEYEEKGKGYLLGEDRGGRMVSVVQSVADAGKITKDYANQTLDAFRGETTSAACILGASAPNSCWDYFHEQEVQAYNSGPDLDREAGVFLAKSYGAGDLLTRARHALLGGEGADLFFESFP